MNGTAHKRVIHETAAIRQIYQESLDSMVAKPHLFPCCLLESEHVQFIRTVATLDVAQIGCNFAAAGPRVAPVFTLLLHSGIPI